MYYLAGGRRYRREAVREISTRYWYERDFRTLLGARIKGRGEGRGLRVFDEAHNELNNREWEKDEQKLMLKRLSLSRKRGWEDYIISQHKKNTDVAIRRIAHSEIQVVDFQKLVVIPILGTKLLPFHFFRANEYKLEENAMGGEKLGKRIRMEFYTLNWWKNIYDTFEDYEFEDTLDDFGIVLPLTLAQLLAATEGGAEADTPLGAAGAPVAAVTSLKVLGGASNTSDTPPDAS
jgi:hypothetical protein